MLKERRRVAILAALESRIRTQAEREEFAKQKLRDELVGMAANGNAAGIKDLLTMIANEAESTNTRPR